MTKKPKVFIWRNVDPPPYGQQDYIAVADSMEQARALALKAEGLSRDSNLDRALVGRARWVDRFLSGPPDEIHDLPFGIFESWAE